MITDELVKWISFLVALVIFGALLVMMFINMLPGL